MASHSHHILLAVSPLTARSHVRLVLLCLAHPLRSPACTPRPLALRLRALDAHGHADAPPLSTKAPSDRKETLEEICGPWGPDARRVDASLCILNGGTDMVRDADIQVSSLRRPAAFPIVVRRLGRLRACGAEVALASRCAHWGRSE